ncbi:transporter [Azospirillum sp. RWY-5-1]|uniref:Transporter n=1 Tax=Azospirillum oleiclasticum TaxID=2735135 RepID=A0ABX2TGM0_9PROT|nr:permease [Azospirillum oleiclasticum]NYZ14701.1 transporter [Azospirillum oleiclasticum]NYZ22313.1 transporter [Azospirillum oleiclasticum]
MDQVWQALYTGAGMLWQALWALIFGYVISAGIQVLVSREQMGRALGDRGVRPAGLAAFFGFISSSCSFAALAASRSVLVKGAHPVNALAFLISSTNLVIELGIVLWVLLGWRFTLANILLGLVMVVYAYALTALWFPARLAEAGRRHAEQAQKSEGMDMEPDSRGSWRDTLASRQGWRRIARAFVMEWAMVWKEILFGFTVAGFISVLVPQSFWDFLFVGNSEDPGFWAVVENAAVAPVVAFFTFIGSMGNVPLAAMLWSKEVSFGGVLSFLGADLVAATVVWIHAKYYGWKYAGYLSVVMYLCMVAAGITVHYLYELTGLMPTERPSLQEMVRFAIDHTFFLNLAFGALAVWLFRLHRSGGHGQPEHAHHAHGHA